MHVQEWYYPTGTAQSISGHNRIIIKEKRPPINAPNNVPTTPNKPACSVRAQKSILVIPTRVIAIENHNDEIEIYMNNGWQVNLKLSLSELSMINDIRLVGVPAM